MNISRIAKLADVNVETIRYYQRRGLIAKPAKPLGSYRRYSPEIVSRIRYIKRAQALGFSLDEIAVLLQPPTPELCSKMHAIAQSKIGALHGQIAELQQRLQILEMLIGQCPEIPACDRCPLRTHLSCDEACREVRRRPATGKMP